MNELHGFLGNSIPYSTSSEHPGILTLNLKEAEHLLPSIPVGEHDLVVVSAPGVRAVEWSMRGGATFKQDAHVHVVRIARKVVCDYELPTPQRERMWMYESALGGCLEVLVCEKADGSGHYPVTVARPLSCEAAALNLRDYKIAALRDSDVSSSSTLLSWLDMEFQFFCNDLFEISATSWSAPHEVAAADIDTGNLTVDLDWIKGIFRDPGVGECHKANENPPGRPRMFFGKYPAALKCAPGQYQLDAEYAETDALHYGFGYEYVDSSDGGAPKHPDSPRILRSSELRQEIMITYFSDAYKYELYWLDATRFVTMRRSRESENGAPIFHEYWSYAEALAGLGRLMAQDVEQYVERSVE
tara:strand:- start:312 stop:1385 length:1074 start_codon:yes stop_codon:yes gene_type:complete